MKTSHTPKLNLIPTGTAGSAANRSISFSLIIIACWATIAGLVYFRDFLTPIAMALLLSSLFWPIVRYFERFKIPPFVSATVIVIGLVTLVTIVGASLSDPFHDWLDTLPRIVASAQDKVRQIVEPVRTILGQKSSRGSMPVSDMAPPGTAVNVMGGVMGGTAKVVGRIAEVILLLLLVLAGGRRYFQKGLNLLSNVATRSRLEQTAKEANQIIFRYLAVSLFINIGQGIIVATIMWRLGLPAPLFWGIATLVLEFIPYLGASVMVVMLLMTGITTLDSLTGALIAPTAYLIVATLQNNLVSPLAYSRRLNLNPVAILMGVAFWWFIWGVPGAFLAVPILATTRVAASKSSSMKWVGEIFSE